MLHPFVGSKFVTQGRLQSSASDVKRVRGGSRGWMHGQMRALMHGLALLAVALLWLGGARGVQAGRDALSVFSPQERSSLDNGGLVQRPQERRRGRLHLVGGTSYQVIDAPIHVVWQALLDTQHYPRMMPQVLEAKVVKEERDRRTLFMRQGAAGLVETTYYLNISVDPERRDIEFRMDEDRPHDLRAAWGFYNARPYGDGSRTLLTYGVMADLGDGLLIGLARDSVHQWMLRTPWMMKRFIEGSGRYIYDWRAQTRPVKDRS